MLMSKLKEAIICFKNLRVTLPYPAKPAPPAEGFRGRLDIDIDKCIGCGACANACPPRLILITNVDSRRSIDFILGKCTYCARCAEVCPEQAITMSREFELATDNKADLNIAVELAMVRCQECGTAFTTKRIADKLTALLPEKIEIEPSALDWINLCPDCRRLKEMKKLVEAGE
jgi:hydrogenase-4 component H